jgi:hypothetical protein
MTKGVKSIAIFYFCGGPRRQAYVTIAPGGLAPLKNIEEDY